MALGTRRLTGPVPLRSRVGNALTSVAFNTVTGLRIADAQTGLRAYPPRLLPWLLACGRGRFG